MKISRIVEFLQSVEEREGDINMQGITGFWVRSVPATGERIVACAVGDGMSLDDVLRQNRITDEPVIPGSIPDSRV